MHKRLREELQFQQEIGFIDSESDTLVAIVVFELVESLDVDVVEVVTVVVQEILLETVLLVLLICEPVIV